ncbi:helix-turn-helix domain-containing protein [Allomesorhizobium alhagi]|uniref:XRE family transcriptional regulator n=1 Tax=Mesorhizobium alhagi CCNWXJ12-2 TaxID=1107882 RepID=H0I155_9HYPH|nr:helix-turn-helix transcriptional regulator [Mesorhizobium alhagi]EHK53302.1 XRE family transcriptional regulator [Mesorhizobium alhagi CCNWXJ12-2]
MRLRSVVSRNLRLLRHTAGLTQHQLAELAGCDRNYIGKLEREENSPTVDTLESIATALQINVELLIKRDLPPDHRAD